MTEAINVEPLSTYDKIIVAFSGGKDSLACLLSLLHAGVQKERIELWHHDIDGREGSTLMDWPITADYCRAVARELGVPLYFSWREGGFEGEMNRDKAPTGKTFFETNDGLLSTGGHGPDGTRLKFPQVSADLKVRWCSAYLKIDIARRVFANHPDFRTGRFLLVTGERRQESTARSRYNECEVHNSSSGRRLVHQYRAVIDWTEEQVWAIIEQYRLRPHPAYLLGWGRVSCLTCIFGGPDQWASALELDPPRVAVIAAYERKFGATIHRKDSVTTQATRGTSYLPNNTALKALALSTRYTDRVRLDPKEEWRMPLGAFKRAGGPT